jgi:hypothetical protein
MKMRAEKGGSNKGSKSDKISLGMAVHTYNPSTPRLKQKYHEF